MKPKIYEILCRCIDDGIKYGYQKSFKHTDSPDEVSMRTNIYHAVMNEIYEYFEFNESEK